MNSNLKRINLIKKDDVPRDTNVYFIIEFYKQKPHWDSEYYDVLSGCKDTFDTYRKSILKDKTSVKASFELKDFENALFRFDYKKYGINPVDIAYIKIIDDKGIFQDANWKNTYFFVTNVSFMSTEIAVLTGQLDIWMTYWPQLKFNGKSIKCLRKHMPRYRTDKGHEGEYDFSTDSCVLNVDQMEGQYTNLVSYQSWPLQTSLKGKGRENINYITDTLNFSINEFLWVYCMVIPKSDDKIMNNVSINNFVKVDDLINKKPDNIKDLNYLYLDIDSVSLSKSSNMIKGCPWFLFSVTNETKNQEVIVKLKEQTTSQKRETYITYNYKSLSFMGKRLANIFFVDHPIFYYNLDENKEAIVESIVFINDVSDRVKDHLPDNIQEVCSYTFNNFDNIGWYYEQTNIIGPPLNFFEPLKSYTENDAISLDQEPALFRYPHFEFEYSMYTAKGVLKVQNELLLSEGWFEEYGGLFCDYIIHGTSIQKYLYVKNGWYKAQYNLWKFGLFEENDYSFDLISDTYQDFLNQNRSQFNNSYNQSMTNGFLGIAEAGIGLALAPFTGGMSAVAGVGLAVGAGLSIANNAKNMYFASMSRQAKIEDLQRTPSTRVNPSNSFSNTALNQMKNNNDVNIRYAKGFVLARQHRENEQWILYSHFHQNGYLVNKLLAVKDLNWFYSRNWFDFFQIEDFTTVIDNTKYSQYILNKFNNLFHRGVRLWHTTEHFLDYSLNNKEIDEWKKVYLKK